MSETKNCKNIRIATRASTLALWQANQVSGRLQDNGYSTTLVKILSTGDKVLDKPLDEIGGKGLFIKELEQALLDDQADIAVHSLKDLPAVLPEPFKLAALAGFGASRGDLLMLHPRHANSYSRASDALKQINIVATGSARRRFFLKHAYPHIQTPLLRGNMQTRFEKLLNSEHWDAIILAAAAAERLPETKEFILLEIDPSELTPAAGQAIVGIECKKDAIFDLSFLADEQATIAGTTERTWMRAMGAACTTPVGCHAYQKDSAWKVDLSLWSANKKFQATGLCIETTWPEILELPDCKKLALELTLKGT